MRLSADLMDRVVNYNSDVHCICHPDRKNGGRGLLLAWRAINTPCSYGKTWWLELRKARGAAEVMVTIEPGFWGGGDK